MTTTTDDNHPVPTGLQEGGERLWSAITDAYELAAHELSILLEAARTVDALSELQKIVDVEGVTNTSPQGVRAHPALVELRNQRVTLAKLVASLRIPLADEEEAGRTPQRRVGIRAVSSIR